MEDKCYACGEDLTPVAEMSLSERIEMEQNFRKEFPNTWHKNNTNKIRVCDDCYYTMDQTEPPDQYEIRRMLEDD